MPPPPSRILTPPCSTIDPRNFHPTLRANYVLLHQLHSSPQSAIYKLARPRTSPSEGRTTFALKVVRRSALDRTWSSVRIPIWDVPGEGVEQGEDGLYRVPREAFVLSRLRIEEVVKLEELYADADYYYMVLEYFGDHSQPPTVALAMAPTVSTSSTATTCSASSPPLLSAPMLERTSSSASTRLAEHGRLSERQARHVFRQLISLVVDLQAVGLSHSALSPEHILLDSRLSLKLIDLSHCQVFRNSLPSPRSEQPALDRDELFPAPELVRRPRSTYELFPAEVWSLGVLLHHLLADESPFMDELDAREGRRQYHKSWKWSMRAERLLRGCLKVEREERWTLEQVANCEWLKGR